MKRASSFLAFLLIFALALPGCSNGNQGSQGAQSGGGSQSDQGGGWVYQRDQLTASLRAEPSNLDPHNNQSLPCFVVEEVILIA